MRLASDLGGTDGFGPVVAEPNEPVFHARWEGRVLGLTLAMGATGAWTLDRSRFAREDRPAGKYVKLRYYELWLIALERLLIESDLITERELSDGASPGPPAAFRRRLNGSDVEAAQRRGSPSRREPASVSRFAVGDIVTTSSAERAGHTRLPTYARGKRGRVTAIHGCHVFPDANAHGLGEQPQWLYTVEFSAPELFGSDGDPGSSVSIDAFEPYLEAT